MPWFCPLNLSGLCMTKREQVITKIFGAPLRTSLNLDEWTGFLSLCRTGIDTDHNKLLLVSLLTTFATCWLHQTYILDQLVASLLASSTFLQDDNNLFQTCQQPGTMLTSCDFSPTNFLFYKIEIPTFLKNTTLDFFLQPSTFFATLDIRPSFLFPRQKLGPKPERYRAHSHIKGLNLIKTCLGVQSHVLNTFHGLINGTIFGIARSIGQQNILNN